MSYIAVCLCLLCEVGLAQSRPQHRCRRVGRDSAAFYASRLPVSADSAVMSLLLQTKMSVKAARRLTLADYPATADRVVHHFENHGYPFVTVSLETLLCGADTAAFGLHIDPGPFITFDSIAVKGGVRLSRHFLYPYLGLRRGRPYREERMRSVNAMLDGLPFAVKVRDAGVSFVDGKACLYVYLAPRRTSRFDGYLGLVPADGKTGKVSVHGALDLDLRNLLRQGEQIRLAWAGSGQHSQKLDLVFRLPYIAESAFGADARFQMDKQDTSYLTLSYHVGIPCAIARNGRLQPYFDFMTSSVLRPGTTEAGLGSGTDTGPGAGYTDYRKTLYGLKLRYSRVDNPFNPRRGIELNADLSAGRRVIVPGGRGDAALYDGKGPAGTSCRAEGSVAGYIPMGKRFVLILETAGGSLPGGGHYGNELFKIGGGEYVRGFNIDDLTASTYLLGKTEVRCIVGRQSYLHAFFDGCICEQNLNGGHYVKDFPMGLGLGLTFSTKAGMFYFDYALGRRQGSPFSFKTGKIHFGVRTLF